LYTTVFHKTAQNSYINLPFYPPVTIAHVLSTGGEEVALSNDLLQLRELQFPNLVSKLSLYKL